MCPSFQHQQVDHSPEQDHLTTLYIMLAYMQYEMQKLWNRYNHHSHNSNVPCLATQKLNVTRCHIYDAVELRENKNPQSWLSWTLFKTVHTVLH